VIMVMRDGVPFASVIIFSHGKEAIRRMQTQELTLAQHEPFYCRLGLEHW
jgi:hypothetical protein